MVSVLYYLLLLISGVLLCLDVAKTRRALPGRFLRRGVGQIQHVCSVIGSWTVAPRLTVQVMVRME